MQQYFNKTFRNRFTQSMYVDKYLDEMQEGHIADMKAYGIDVTPRDENDIYVPLDKNTPKNLEEVQHSMNKAYGLDL